ncbi:MAG: CHAT domain-containing protein [Spirulina sp.]
MLKEFKGGDYAKQQLARKFTAFNQLTVSLALQSGHPRNALTLAETGKNTCLRWIWNYGEIPELTYPQIRELLATPATALIYWHLSPISLSTFLLLPNDPDPILISPPPPTQPEDEREPALLQVLAFEEWVKKWNEDYDNYETKKDEENPSKIDVTWYEELETQLAQLKTLLNIAAIEQHLKTHAINHLILIPHRDLHRFPLPTFFPDRPCTILPSAYLGMSENNPPDPDIAADILIVENPPSKPKIGNQPKPLPGLPFAEVESALIQQQFRDSGSPLTKGGRGGFQCLPNNNATKTRVTEALQQSHHIFHFCGHGAYHSQNPALSSLYLNGEDTLTLKDILNLDLREYRLVVLSACETAVTGNQTITDEYVGLVSGFLRAGATHVLSTLWTVQSFATTLLVVTFYQNLHSGQSPATALKNAQSWLKTATKTDLQTWLDDAIATLQQDFSFKRLLEIRRQNIDTMESDRPYAHPYYWSAFTLSGR